MKSLFTIPLALLILLSGMHITIATHFCGGVVAANRVSLSGVKATCGMEHDGKSDTSEETHLSSNCCENKSSIYSIESNYAPSAFCFKEYSQYFLLEFHIPVGYSFHTTHASITFPANASPPGHSPANAVSMADICVFRI